MSNTSTASASATVGFPVASLAVFVLLIMKLGNIAGLGDLSWWWVFSPYLIGLAMFFGTLLFIAIVGGIAVGIAMLLDKRKAKKRRKARESQFQNNRNRPTR